MENWILIVEDDPNDAALICRALGRWKRSEFPQVCGNTTDALELLATSPSPPRMVILDGQLPGISSAIFLQRFRESSVTQFVPVVLFSGHGEAKCIVEALTAGANSYVCKAVDYQQIMDELGTMFYYWLDINKSPVEESVAMSHQFYSS